MPLRRDMLTPPLQGQRSPTTALCGFWTLLAAALLATSCSIPPMNDATPPAPAAKATSVTTATAAPQPSADPYLWLEEVQGERALAWVRERNHSSETQLRAHPSYESLRSGVLEVLDSRDQIPYVSRLGPWLYNLWRDAKNPRGLWRRTTLDEYRNSQPNWHTVLDLDALGRTEGQSWVWGGATCLGPEYTRCLVRLSPGGSDAAEVREFDTEAQRFIPAAEGGFVLPQAKSDVEWLDANTVYVGTDFGPGSLTDSGYPRVIKRWQRGQALSQASTVLEGERTDVAVGVRVQHTGPGPANRHVIFTRAKTFFSSEEWLSTGARGATLQRIPKPDDAQVRFWGDQVLVTLRSDGAWAGPAQPSAYPGGSLLVGNAREFMAAQGPAGVRWTALFTPQTGRSLKSYALAADTVLVSVMEHVAGRLEEWRAVNGQWVRRAVAAPYPGTLSVTALHDPQISADPLGHAYLLNASDFLKPDALQLGRVGSDSFDALKTRPSFFDATGLRVEQQFARSADGTRVPYFIVWPRGALAQGDNPTLLYGYGGFEVSLTPYYSGAIGRSWAARGVVFVLANIRGGGEYGPAWHQAALRANKQKSYDDFAAVAEDLIARKVTRPSRLGIQGGSNGGLLVGAVMLQRPELFGAVVCQVPLLDMQRYHKLLAGASWMEEYGNPDQAADWAFISRYSPYQNVPQASAAKPMPKVLFATSTRDDRVHPGHARKMAARMQERGHSVLYWENTEGGHGGAADNGQRATMLALEYSFLWQTLGAPERP